MRDTSDDDTQAFSYKQLRRVIGILGMLLPVVVVALGPWPLKQSISAYYYSNVRDFFVGLLGLTGAFLLCYNGYKDDPPVPVLAGITALGVAFFPTIPGPQDGNGALGGQPVASVVGLFGLPIAWSARIHYVCAVALFASLAYMSGRLFRRTNQPVLGQKSLGQLEPAKC